MRITRTIQETREAVRAAKAAGRAVAFVPTMGYLHDGHASLIRAAGEDGSFVAVSIFVNPLQFGPKEDLASYPRDLDHDLRVCESAGADMVFAPGDGEMYAAGHSTFVEETAVSAGLCGASRPGHFRGVATVVMKLFQIVQPDAAFFGMKDAQQVAVVRRMVRDLNVPVRIVAVPTVREPDGLAMSSRNTYLSRAERTRALCLQDALLTAERMCADGPRAWADVKAAMLERILAGEPPVVVDYVEAVDADSLRPVERVERGVRVLVAVRVGRTRLIDNRLIGEPVNP